jgi:hypothetical protein
LCPDLSRVATACAVQGGNSRNRKFIGDFTGGRTIIKSLSRTSDGNLIYQFNPNLRWDTQTNPGTVELWGSLGIAGGFLAHVGGAQFKSENRRPRGIRRS